MVDGYQVMQTFEQRFLLYPFEFESKPINDHMDYADWISAYGRTAYLYRCVWSGTVDNSTGALSRDQTNTV